MENVAKGPGKGPGKFTKGNALLKTKKVSAPFKTKSIYFFYQFSNVQMLCASQIPSISQSASMQGQGDNEHLKSSEGYACGMNNVFSSADPNENQIINTDSARIELPKILKSRPNFQTLKWKVWQSL